MIVILILAELLYKGHPKEYNRQLRKGSKRCVFRKFYPLKFLGLLPVYFLK